MTPLEQVNVRRALLHVQKNLENLIANPVFDYNESDSIRQASQGFLDEMVKRKAIISGEVVSTETKTYTWKDLYPSWFNRTRARIAKAIGLRETYFEQRWFHVFFPYVMNLDIHALDEFFDEDTDKKEYRNYIFPQYRMCLTFPYKAVAQTVHIRPAVPIERISLHINVERQ